MADFGVPRIGKQRQALLAKHGILDAAGFREASQDTIRKIGNAHVLQIWLMDQKQHGRFGKTTMSDLDNAKAQCELDLRRQTRKTIGELDRDISTIPDSDLPPTCASNEVKLLMSQEQQFPAWVKFISKEINHVRAQKMMGKLFSGRTETKVGEEKVGEPAEKLEFHMIITPNNVFLGQKKYWDFLFPHDSSRLSKNPAEMVFSTQSDAIGALLQALTNDREMPDPALLHSVSDQLLVLAQSKNMPFLNFLAVEYDDYPKEIGQSFRVSHVYEEGEAGFKPEAIKYFIKYGVQPFAANMTQYIDGLSPEEIQKDPNMFASLWLQALRIDPKQPARSASLQALKNKNDSLTAEQKKLWQKQLVESVKQNALRRRVANTFNTLAELKKSLGDFRADTVVDPEWSQIILRESVPVSKVLDLGFTFDADKAEEPFHPFYDKIRASLDSKDTFDQFIKMFGYATLEAVPDEFKNRAVPVYVFKTKKLLSDEEKQWMLDLALVLGKSRAFKVWGRDAFTDEQQVLMPA